MPETDSTPGAVKLVSSTECLLTQRNILQKIDAVHSEVEENTETSEKILKILQGNGQGGLIWKVNLLMLRNQWADKIIGIGLSILSTLITLYLSGVLKL